MNTDLAESAVLDVDDDDDGVDDLVLPWWYSWWRVALLTAALTSAVIGLVAITVGGRTPGPNSVDVGFLQDMRSHHDQAVQMSLIYRAADDTDKILGLIADEVLLSQVQDTGVMIEILRGFGAEEENSTGLAMGWMGHEMALDQMTGMATQAQIEALVAADGAEADRLFIELMTAHHEGGLEMADYAAVNASSQRVRDLAGAMARSQRSEIAELAQIADRIG